MFSNSRAAAAGRAVAMAPTSFVNSGEVGPNPASKRRKGGPAGARRGDTASEAVTRGSLNPPNPAALVATKPDLLPTPAEVSNTPHLLGEQGGPGTNPAKELAKKMTAMATSPAAVSPGAMGMEGATRMGAIGAVSTQHTPDAGVESQALERAKQLPSTTGYQAFEQSVELQQSRTGGSTTNAKRRMSLFR